jgi:hypothetical protein
VHNKTVAGPLIELIVLFDPLETFSVFAASERLHIDYGIALINDFSANQRLYRVF